MIRVILIIGIGGFAGTIARFLFHSLISRFYPVAFPAGTFSINLLGCLLIGVFYALSEKEGLLPPEWRMFLTTGFCGGFTTLSAFSFESVQLMNAGEYKLMIVYSFLTVVFGILMTISGIWLTKSIIM